MALDLSALFKTLRQQLVAIAFRIVHDRDDAEDVVQEAFVALLESDRVIEHPDGYLRGIVRHIAIERVRATVRLLPLLIDPVAPSATTDGPSVTRRVKSFAGRAGGNRQRRKLWVVWKGLAEGRTHREIAGELGTTKDAVKGLLRRSRQRVRSGPGPRHK